MADNDKRKFDIPWATLLPIIAALAGIVAQFRPLVSERPAVPGEKAVEVVAEQDVDARLWQDPLVVAQKKKAELDAEALKKQVPLGRTQVHEIDALKKLVDLSVHASPPNGRILLLAVMLDSGPYIEQVESRLRARQAVLEGLSESGFVPKDSEHIGFVNWIQDRGEDKETLIPWEECKVVDDPHRVYPRNTQGAFLLWLPSASFTPHPLESFAALIGQLVEEIRDQITNIAPVVPPFKMSVEIIREKDCVAKYWPQSAEDHELVINIRTEQTDGANSTSVFAPPLHLFIPELTRESTKEVRLIQSFSRLFGLPLCWSLAILFILAPSCLSLFTRKTPVDPAQVAVR